MKISAVDKRTFIVSTKEAQALTEANSFFVTINGNVYYLAKCSLLYRDVYEVTFMSKNQIEIEVEVCSKCQEKENLCEKTTQN